MTPIDISNINYNERDEKMRSEVNEYIEANVYAAELWKDKNITDTRNIELYKKILRKMKIFDIYEMHQNRGKIIIMKRDNK